MDIQNTLVKDKEWVIAGISGLIIGIFTKPKDIEFILFAIVLATFIIRKIYGGKYGTEFDRMDILWVLAMIITYIIGITIRRVYI